MPSQYSTCHSTPLTRPITENSRKFFSSAEAAIDEVAQNQANHTYMEELRLKWELRNARWNWKQEAARNRANYPLVDGLMLEHGLSLETHVAIITRFQGKD